MIKKLIFLFVLSTVFIYSQNNRLDFTVEEVNQLLYKASSSIQPADTTALMFRVRQEALAKMNYADTSFLFDRAKTFIKDSLNTIRTDLDVVRNEVNQRLTSTQVRSLISDSLTANVRSWQTSQDVAEKIRDSLNLNARGWQNKAQVSAIIKDSLDANTRDLTTLTDSLNLIRADLDIVRNEVNKRLDTVQVKSLISDSLGIVRTDIDIVRNETGQYLDSTQIKLLISDSLNIVKTDLNVVKNEVNQHLDSTQIKTLVSDSLDIIRVDLNTIRNEISLYTDTTQIGSLLDSLSIIRGDLNTVSNNLDTVKNIANQHLDSIRIKFLISDSLNIVKTDLDLVKNEVAQRLDSLQVKSLISDSLSLIRVHLNIIGNDIAQNLDSAEVGSLLSDSLDIVRNDLNIIRTDLDTVKNDLNIVRTDLDTAITNLGTVRSDLNIIRTDLDTVRNNLDTVITNLGAVQVEINQHLDSAQIKLLVSDSLNIIRTDLNTINNEIAQHLDSIQVNSLISDSLDIVRNNLNIVRTDLDTAINDLNIVKNDLDTVKNEIVQHLDSTQVKLLISDSLSIVKIDLDSVKTDLNTVKNEINLFSDTAQVGALVDSLSIIRNDLSIVTDKANQHLDSTQIKFLISDSLYIVKTDLNTVRDEVSRHLDSTQIKSLITDSLNTVRFDLDIVRNEVNQHLDSSQVKSLVSDSLIIVRNDLNTVKNEINYHLDSTQVKSLILDSLSTNARNWQSKTQVSTIIRDSLTANTRNWQTLQDVSTIVNQSESSVLTTLADSIKAVRTDLNTVGYKVDQRLDSIQVKSLISDSLNLVRNDLNAVWNEVNQHTDSVQVKSLITDSLTANTRNWQNKLQVSTIIKDSLDVNTRNWQNRDQVSVMISQSENTILSTLSDSLSLIRSDLDTVEYKVSQQLDSTQIKLLISDSLNANTRGWQTLQDVSAMIAQNENSILTKVTDSLNLVKTDLNVVTNEINQYLDSAQVKSLISDSLSLVRNDIDIIRTEVDQQLDSTQVKFLISDSLNANSRNWQDKAGVSAIIGDSLNTNARGWQTLQDVSTIVSQSEDSITTVLIDSLNLLEAELNAKINALEQLINTPGVLPDYLTLSFTDVNFDTVTTYDDASGNLYTVLNITNDSSDIIGIENTHGLGTPFYADSLDHIYVNTGERRIVNIYTTSTKPDNSYIDTLFITTTEKITQKVTVRFAVSKWYVDPSAINGKNDGTSWENAWTSFDNIDWTAMQGSDSIFISGGIDSVVYNTTGITIKGNNVIIAKGTTPGHNGRVIFNASNIGSDTAVYLDEKKNVTIDGLEFVNYGKGVFMKSRNPAGVENIFIKNCKMYFTVDTLSKSDNDIKFVGTDHGGTSDTNSFNRFNSIHIVNNEFTSPEWSTSSIHILNLLNSWNVYIVGNKFINQNNNPDVGDYWYYSNTTHSYLLRNLFYYHDAKARPGGISSSYGIYGSEKAGYNVMAFNIFVTTDSIFYPPIYEVYYPKSYPTVFRRDWERLIVVNNTFFGSQRKISYGSDINAYVANNIFYRSNTAINGGAGYIQGSEIGNPVLDSIRYNAFVDFGQGGDTPAWVSGYSNSSLPASNYAIRTNNSLTWYDVFTSGLLKLSEPDPVVRDNYFEPNVTQPFYIDGEDMQRIIPQKVIDSNMKEPGLSWFEYYWNNAADYYSNPYRNKVGAIQR